MSSAICWDDILLVGITESGRRLRDNGVDYLQYPCRKADRTRTRPKSADIIADRRERAWKGGRGEGGEML